MRRASLTLVRLGHRCGRGAGAEGMVHRAAVVAAAAVAVLIAWLFVVTTTVYHQREVRMAARSPIFVGSGSSPQAVAWWQHRGDTAHQRQFSVITVVPLRPDAPPPPGLPRWPNPGEAFLSPQLAALDASGDLHRRYGTAAGLIGLDGLADPNEFLVYQRPALPALPEAAPESAESGLIRGFGVPVGQRLPLDSTVNDQSLSQVLEGLAVLVLPVGALLIVAARTGAGRRDARLAMLDALGAPTRARAWVLLGEVLLPAGLGVVIGGGAALVGTMVDLTLPFSGYRLRAPDLAHTRSAVLVCVVACYLGMLAVTLVAQMRRRSRPGNRPRAAAGTVRRWPVAGFAVAMGAAAVGAAIRGNEGRILFTLGMLMTLATLPVVATLATGGLARVVARAGAAAGSASAIVGGRWLAARPAVIARTGAVLVIGLGLACQAQVIQSQLTAVGKQGSRLHERVGDSVVELRASPRFPQELPAFQATLAPGRVMDVYREDLPPEPGQPTWRYVTVTTVVAPAEVLARLGHLTQTPATPTPVATAYRDFDPLAYRLREAGVLGGSAVQKVDPLRVPGWLMVSTTAPASGKHVESVVLNTEGAAGVQALKHAAFATTMGVSVTVQADDFEAATADYAALVHWILDVGTLVMAILILAGAVASASVFVAQCHELGPLSAFRTDRTVFHSVAVWNLGAPLVAVSLVGMATAAALGLLLTRLAPLSELSVPFLGVCLAMAVAAAAVVAVGCGEVATRSARTWRPAGE